MSNKFIMTNKFISTAKTIYDFIKLRVPNVPPFYFQLGLSNQSGLIFTTTENTEPLYFSTNANFSFIIRLYEPKWEHITQLDCLLNIYEAITSAEFKNLVYESGKTTLTYIDDAPNPDAVAVVPSLETYNETSQCYSFKLSIILERKQNEHIKKNN